jgi:hypothetical protein
VITRKSVAREPVPAADPFLTRETSVNSKLNQRELSAKTESLFRDVNERIAETSERFDSEEAQFMCECSDSSCAEPLEVPLTEYEQVREDPTTFVLNPEHVEPKIEKIVRHRSGYAVVRKVDAIVARIVRGLDPRADPAR